MTVRKRTEDLVSSLLRRASLSAAVLLLVQVAVYAQSGRVRGTVTDTSHLPLIGVNIVQKGTGNGTVTNLDGQYTLSGIQRGDTIVFSYVGFRTVELSWSGAAEMNVTLHEDQELLDELVVVGYGTAKKENLTGAVDQVTSEAFENRPITNVTQGLVGVIPNLNVTLTDGKPTQSPSYNVRGTTSIGQGGSALVLVDGVEGDPRMLNPNDIESISVLKDAASASIYGARAAFGVVLITTKKAKEGKTNITYSANFSSKSPTTVPDYVTDGYTWAKGFADAYMNWNDNGLYPNKVNKTLIFSEAYLKELKRRSEDPSLPRLEVDPSTGRYIYYDSTDWYKELYKDQFFATDHNLSVSGGNDLATYYLSLRYNGQDGLFRYNSDKYNMFNMRGRGTVQLTPWLQLDNNTEYSVMSYHQPVNVGEGSNIWRNIADEGHPLAPMTNPDGTLTFPAAYVVGDMYLGKNYADLSQSVFKNKVALKASFLEDRLTLRADYTFQKTDYTHIRNRVPVPYSQYKGVVSYVGRDKNDFQERSNNVQYMAANVYANYADTFMERNNYQLLLGYNYEQSHYKNLTATRNGLIFDDAKDINMALGDNIQTQGGYEKWRIAGLFFRINYDYDQRYLLEINGRYDGSTKFPLNQQWAFFPSVSLGWRLTEEPFWNVDPDALSNVKLRASYGSLGNGSIGAYNFVETFNINQSGRIIGDGRPQKTSQPNVIPESLTWETSTTANIGLDISALNGRLQFVGDVYRRWTKDMYTKGPSVPAIFGTSVPKGNYASLQTTGWELSLTWQDHFTLADKPFGYSIRGTVADARSFITAFNNDEKRLNDYYVGQEIGEIWGYQVEGLFRSQEEIANSPSQRNVRAHSHGRNLVGDLKFKNLNGDDVISNGNNKVGDSGDLSIIGNSAPHYTYSITLGADWNNLFFTAFFQGVGKQDWFPSRESRFWGQFNRPYNDMPRWQVDQQFRPELQNFDAYLPLISGYNAIGSGRAFTTPSDRYLQNVAYIRLKTLSIGYNLPKDWIDTIGATGISVYLSGENLWTWSPLYKITRDTDVTNVWGGGSQLMGFNSDDTMGNDGYNYPLLKTLSLGFTVNF